MKINNLTTDTTLSKKSDYIYELDLGEVKKGGKGVVQLEFVCEKEVDFIETTVSCPSCTKANYVQNELKEFDVNITFTGSGLGSINKNVRVSYRTLGSTVTEVITINLCGNVVK